MASMPPEIFFFLKVSSAVTAAEGFMASEGAHVLSVTQSRWKRLLARWTHEVCMY